MNARAVARPGANKKGVKIRAELNGHDCLFGIHNVCVVLFGIIWLECNKKSEPNRRAQITNCHEIYMIKSIPVPSQWKLSLGHEQKREL